MPIEIDSESGRAPSSKVSVASSSPVVCAEPPMPEGPKAVGSRDTSESPVKFVKRGAQKAAVAFRRSISKRPAVSASEAAPDRPLKRKPAASTPRESVKPLGSKPRASARSKPRASAGSEPRASAGAKPKASFSHEASRCQFQCRWGVGPGSTAGFAYKATDPGSFEAARTAAEAWCEARNKLE